MKEKKFKTVELAILGVFALIILGVFATIIVLFQATLPRTQVEKSAQQIAEQYANLKKIDQIYLYTRKQTYYTVVGENGSNEKMIVIVPKDSSKLTILKADDCISEEQAKANVANKNSEVATIDTANIGIFENKPVWEIVGKTSEGKIIYFLIDLKTGNSLDKSKVF